MDLISRDESIELGLKTFFTGKKCKHGNVNERRVSNKDCLCNQCRELARNRKKAWALKNKEKVKQYELKNKDKRHLYAKSWALKNIEKVILNHKLYKLKNKEKVYEWNKKRMESKKSSVPKWYGEFDKFLITEAFHLAIKRNAQTKLKWHVDHMIPLNAKEACGLHCGNNIQVIPQRLNNIKVNKMILTNHFEWISYL
jgi:hypothetical protein